MYRIAGIVIIVIINCIFVVFAYHYAASNIFGNRPVAIPIKKSQIDVTLGSKLKHFYTHKPNQTLEYAAPWLTEKVVQHTNADGLADLNDYRVEKGEGVFRIIALGDSFTQGVFVNTREAFPEVLEDMFHDTSYPGINSIEVLNFGVGGYDIEYAAEKLRMQGVKYKPNLVIWLLKFDDFYLINDDMAGARASLEEELNLKNLGINSDKFEETVTWMYAFGELYARHFSVESSIRYQTAKLARVRDYYTGPIMLLYFADEDPMVIRVITQLQNLDSRLLVTKLPAAVSRFPDQHPDAEGHREIARTVYDAVSKYVMEAVGIPHER